MNEKLPSVKYLPMSIGEDQLEYKNNFTSHFDELLLHKECNVKWDIGEQGQG